MGCNLGLMFGRKPFLYFFSLLLTFAFCSDGKSADASQGHEQLVLVTTSDWNDITGKLVWFEKKLPSGWRIASAEIPVVVGRSGLAWGRGLHTANFVTGPVKKEGDGKSPAGIFGLSSAFGFEAAKDATFVKLPYQQLLPPVECVDDTNSVHYNKIVDKSGIKKTDWSGSEKMLAVGEQYRWGVFVDHNSQPPMAGAGSCIFLHIWKNEKTGTSGCTAMKRKDMEDLLHWLSAEKHPVLVQLPESEYQRLKGDWNLP